MGVFRVKFGSTVHSVRKYLQTFFENRLVSEPKESADYIVAHVLGSETVNKICISFVYCYLLYALYKCD